MSLLPPNKNPHATNYSEECFGRLPVEPERCVDVKPQLDGVIRAVNAHYTSMPIEPWDVVDTWPLEQQLGYYRGNLLKYTMRMGSKDARLQEARKALHYAQKLVSTLEKQP